VLERQLEQAVVVVDDVLDEPDDGSSARDPDERSAQTTRSRAVQPVGGAPRRAPRSSILTVP
jgi:hypothetical protein